MTEPAQGLQHAVAVATLMNEGPGYVAALQYVNTAVPEADVPATFLGLGHLFLESLQVLATVMNASPEVDVMDLPRPTDVDALIRAFGASVARGE